MMQSLGTRGQISEVFRREGELIVEWEVPRFLDLQAGRWNWYESPPFSLADARWHLRVRSDCRERLWMHLDLCRDRAGPISITANVSTGFRGTGNRIEAKWEFQKGAGWYLFSVPCKRGELPGGVLTLACHVRTTVTDVEAPATLDPYRNYMTEAVTLPDNINELPSLEFCTLQNENLTKDIGTAEEISRHTDGKPLCQICTLNVATRVAVPCGHWCGCYECAKRLVDTERFYEFTLADGSTEYSDRRLPKTCPTCRAIIGKLLRIF